MNFKIISLIFFLLCLNSKIIAGSLVNEALDLSFGNESDDEFFSSSDEDIELSFDDVDIFSDDEDIATEVIDSIEECLSEECIQTSSRIINKMDFSINPCDDFYHFVCGGWESKVFSNEINDYDTFDILREITNKEINEIIKGEYIVDEKLSKKDQAYDEKTFNKLKNIYNICMNKELNETFPNEYLINFVKELNISENKENLKDKNTFTKMIAKLQTNGIGTFVNYKISRDYDSDIPIITVTLVLSEERYTNIILNYIIAEKYPNSIPIFKDYIKRILSVIRENDINIDSEVDKIFEIEKKMSKLYTLKNLLKISDMFYKSVIPDDYEVLQINDINEKYPFIDWKLYFKRIFKFFNLEEYNKDQILFFNPIPKFYEEINNIVNEMTADDLVNYLEWYVITMNSLNDYVSGDIIEAEKEFNDRLNEFYNNLSNEEKNELFKFQQEQLDDNTNYVEEGEEDEISRKINRKFSKILRKRQIENTEEYQEVENYQGEEDKVEYQEGNYQDEGNYQEEIIYQDDEEEEKRFEICSQSLSNLMPMAIAKYFIKRNFDDNFKEKVEEMIENVKIAMIKRIPKMEWLDKETGKYAIEKVLKMRDRVAYPDDIMVPKKLYEKYKNIEINNYFDYLIKNNVIELGLSLRDVDIYGWLTTPYNVGAYYQRHSNSIIFPAAILQEPFYTNNGQDYINYGSIGAIIGHELTHAFDNNGRLYDADGKKNNWWTDNDNEEFEAYSHCFIDEYNSITYSINDGEYNVDGNYTLGENLADNGGLARAYDAWQISLLKNPKKAKDRNKKLPGFENYTLEQLFYIAYGQNYCSTNSFFDIESDHSPGIARINGVVTNSKHFAKTFNCPTNSPMNPEIKCIIW